MVLMLDNYDSFTYNLVQYLRELGAEVEVVRNDATDFDGIAAKRPEALVISPGPCAPPQAGISVAAIQRFAGQIPILGVCLGHQCIGAAYGGRIVRAPDLMHGKTSLIHHRGQGLFQGLANPFEATRYHSLVVAPESLPAELQVTAWTEAGDIMGMAHRRLALWGVQFHPESILSRGGKALLKNFLRLAAPTPSSEAQV